MFRPSDLQLVLLTTAAQRADGSLLPPPDSIGGQAVRIRRSIPPLIKNGLVSETAITDASIAWREDSGVSFGAFITDTGREMIGAEPSRSDPARIEQPAEVSGVESAPAKTTKSGMVIDMLRRADGATLHELISATSWLPHTTRAALTGLRKKGHTIVKGKRDNVTCYSIANAA